MIPKNLVRKFRKYFPLSYSSLGNSSELELGSLIQIPEGYHPTNPSFVKIDNDYLICTRLVNYRLHDDCTTKSYFTSGADYHSIYRFFVIDDAGRLLRSLDSLNDFFEQREDIRLLINEEGVLAVYNERGANGSCRMGYAQIDQDMVITHHVVYDTLFDFRLEKNWSPFLYHGNLHFIYSLKPLIILRANADGTTSPVNVPNVDDLKSQVSFYLSGSSAGEKCAEGWRFLFHRRKTRLFSRKRQIYVNYFVTLDESMRAVKIGRPFTIGQPTIQFVCGYLTDGDSTRIGYGRADREAKLLSVPSSKIQGLL